MQKFKNILDQSTKILSILAIIAFVFAAWFAIQFAKSKTKKEFDARQTYFNDVHTHFNKDWATNTYWDSTQTEKFNMVSTNGDLWSFELSKQKFNDQFNVKTNTTERPDLYDVMHMQIAHKHMDSTVRADMSTLRMNTLVLHKMTVASIVPEGITYKSYTNQKSIISMKYDSYKDQEGRAEKVFEKDLMFLDQLPYVLRSYNVDDTTSFNVRILETQLGPGVGKFNVYKAHISLANASASEYTINVDLSNNTQYSYTFERNFPNRLLVMNYKAEKYLRKE